MSSEYEPVYYILLLYCCVNFKILRFTDKQRSRISEVVESTTLAKDSAEVVAQKIKEEAGAAERRDQTRSEYKSR